MTILCYQIVVQLPTGYSHQNVPHISQFQFGNLRVSKGKHIISLALKPTPSSFYSTIYWDSHARNLGVILGLSFILFPYIYWVMMPDVYLLNVSENISFLPPLLQLMAWTTWQVSRRSHSLQFLPPQFPASIPLSNLYMSPQPSFCKSCRR